MPHSGRNGGGDRHFSRDLFFIVIGNRGSFIHAAQPGRGAAGVQHGRDQGGFAGVGMANHDEISDIFAFVNLQSAS